MRVVRPKPTFVPRVCQDAEKQRDKAWTDSASGGHPRHVKEQMIDWLGPIISEYYGGSETGPIVWCNADEWLKHPGTVGAPADGADVRIVDADGMEVAAGEVGVIYVKPADYWCDGARRRRVPACA